MWRLALCLAGLLCVGGLQAQDLTPNGPSVTTPANTTVYRSLEGEVANQTGPARPWLVRYGLKQGVELRVSGDLCAGQGAAGLHVATPCGAWVLGGLVQQGRDTTQALMLASLDRGNSALDLNTGYTWVHGQRCSFASAAFSEQMGRLNLGAEVVRQVGVDGVAHLQPMVYGSYQIGDSFIPNLEIQRDMWNQGQAWSVTCGATFRIWAVRK